jgi:hypothetical protein
LPEDSARYCRRRRLPWTDPLRHAEVEIAVFAGSTEVDNAPPDWAPELCAYGQHRNSASVAVHGLPDRRKS